MKKSILFVISLLLFNLVSANANLGNTFKLDFSESSSYTIGLNNGDRVEFKLKDALHTTLVKKITKESVEIATFTYIQDENPESKTPYYTRLNSEKFLKLDLEKDGTPDLYIVYKNSNSTAVSLLFQLPIASNKDLEIFSKSQFGKNDNFAKNLFYLFVIFLVIFIVIYFIFKSKAKETEEIVENTSENKTESKPE